MNVQLRKFEKSDIAHKVHWINDERNNRYLHYDFPLEYEKTCVWFENIKDRTDRYDAVIEYQGIPVGVIGLLWISSGRAEYYITMGEQEFKGKGIAKEATVLLLKYAFTQLGLAEVYLYTEVSNMSAQRLFESCGFIQQRIDYNSAVNRGKYVDRYYYVVTKEDFVNR